jgi:DNA-binding MarR family transcriptional regulator
MTINALAGELVMDRTTLGRNILPLQRDGLIEVDAGRTDRRSKELRLSRSGAARFGAAFKVWGEAQAQFEAEFGAKRAKELRAVLHEIASNERTAMPAET